MKMIDENSVIPTTDKLLRSAMYIAFGGKCFYTNRYLAFDGFHIDHIVPKSAGGKDCVSNYVLCSPHINHKKRDKHIDKFAELGLELNRLLFVNRVIKCYNQILKKKKKRARIRTDFEVALSDAGVVSNTSFIIARIPQTLSNKVDDFIAREKAKGSLRVTRSSVLIIALTRYMKQKEK